MNKTCLYKPIEKKEKKQLSIIIPQYSENEDDIRFLIQSIYDQRGVDFDQIEVLIVGDCGYKLDVSLIDERLGYIYCEENRGAGVARQVGIDNTNGEWIMFIDADDLLYGYLSLHIVMENMSDKVDIMQAKFIHQSKNAYNIVDFDAINWIHSKVYRRKFLEAKNIRFSEKLRCEEDGYFNYLAFGVGANVLKIEQPLTIWVDNPFSITRRSYETYITKYYNQYLGMRMEILEQFQKRKLPNIIEWIAGTIIHAYYMLQYPFWDDEDKNAVIDIMKKFYSEHKYQFSLLEEEKIAQLMGITRANIIKQSKPFIEKITFDEYIKTISEK